MKSAPFEYHAPGSIEEAVGILSRCGDEAKVLAGGQSLVPMLALRLTRFDHLVDLGRIAELRGVETVNGSIRLGAMTPHARVGDDPAVVTGAPLLARATPLIGHFQIRNRGTIGGAIAHADPAAEYPAVLLALDGSVEATGPAGTRTIAACDLFESTWETALAPDEVLTAVTVPRAGPHSGFAVREVARRHGDFALAGIACAVHLDPTGMIERAAISWFAMDATARRAVEAEAALVGQSAAEADVAGVGTLAVRGLEPPSDVHAPASYRLQVGVALATAALGSAIQDAATREMRRA